MYYDDPVTRPSYGGAIGTAVLAWIAGIVTSGIIAALILAVASHVPDDFRLGSVSNSMFYALGTSMRTIGNAHVSGKGAIIIPVLFALPYCLVATAYGLTMGYVGRWLKGNINILVGISALWALLFLLEITSTTWQFMGILEDAQRGFMPPQVRNELNTMWLLCGVSWISAWIAVPFTLVQTISWGRVNRFVDFS